MNTQHKIVPLDRLARWRKSMSVTGQKIVVTNGCFDILHAGHIRYLEEAAGRGKILIIGVNDDAGVRTLKGETRPVNNETDRASVLAALACVNAVCIFPGIRATEFLRIAEPHVYVKGGDYTVETLNPEERAVVQAVGAEIVIVPFERDISTTAMLEKIKKL